MKKYLHVGLFVFLMLIVNLSAFAWGWRPPVDGGGGGNAGAPLDGGLLAILAGAGITYYAVRRKKKNKK